MEKRRRGGRKRNGSKFIIQPEPKDATKYSFGASGAKKLILHSFFYKITYQVTDQFSC